METPNADKTTLSNANSENQGNKSECISESQLNEAQLDQQLGTKWDQNLRRKEQ